MTAPHPASSPHATRTLVARAPARLDFAGGWTDVPPYPEQLGGTVCNVAITRYATATLHLHAGATPPDDETVTRPADQRLIDAALRSATLDPRTSHLSLHSNFPVSAGLGGSSAAGVAVQAVLRAAATDAHPGAPLDAAARTALAEASRRVEVEDAGIAGGRQDHYAAAHGGALRLRFSAAGTEVHRIPLAPATTTELERRCTVVYTGESRISAANITAVLDAYVRGHAETVNRLASMRTIAESCADALAAGDIDRLGLLVSEHWQFQRMLHPAIATMHIEAILHAARAAGALGGKALGASGGGCVLLIASADSAERVRAAVSPLGHVVSWQVDTAGVALVDAHAIHGAA